MTWYFCSVVIRATKLVGFSTDNGHFALLLLALSWEALGPWRSPWDMLTFASDAPSLAALHTPFCREAHRSVEFVLFLGEILLRQSPRVPFQVPFCSSRSLAIELEFGYLLLIFLGIELLSWDNSCVICVGWGRIPLSILICTLERICVIALVK